MVHLTFASLYLMVLTVLYAVKKVITGEKEDCIDCISSCYYVTGKWFTIPFVTAILLLLVPAMEAWSSIVTLLMIFCMFLVGFSPDYKDDSNRDVHVCGACFSMFLSVIYVLHVEPVMLVWYAVALIGLMQREKWLLWCETACFLSVYISTLIAVA